MISTKNYRNFLQFLPILGLYMQCTTVRCANVAPIAGIIPPPQVLLPPHREEGQPQDDIFVGGGISSSRPNGAISVVQTFIPPPVPPTFTTSSTTSTARPFQPRIHSSSAEEIKVLPVLKHRSPLPKQYTKADLIAAANSLKPAGFDFSKVLILAPTPVSRNLTDRRKPATSTTPATLQLPSSAPNQQSSVLSPLYQHIMFPLPLLDTPVFNELVPFMEMLMRQAAASKLGKFGVNSGSGVNSKKVLVILPKAVSLGQQRHKHVPITTTTQKPQRQQSFHHPQPRFQTSQVKGQGIGNSHHGGSSQFLVVPRGSTSRPGTTHGPKIVPSVTTKRLLKGGNFPSKKVDKNPDLQVAATSNKFSQSSGGKLALKGSPSTASDKRSYTLSKGGNEYSFSYSVKNEEYGDVKSHSESRNGDQVAGEYSMLEPDGYTRVVKYTVDSDQGFRASVKRIPPS